MTRDDFVKRFWSKVSIQQVEGGCWTWTASRTRKGYGHMQVDGKLRRAHRVAYEYFVGPIPPGLVLDHLCRNPSCVNPFHLEPVTQRENLLRGDTIIARQARTTECPAGHPYDAANTISILDGRGRRCRQCRNEANRRYKARKKAGR